MSFFYIICPISISPITPSCPLLIMPKCPNMLLMLWPYPHFVSYFTVVQYHAISSPGPLSQQKIIIGWATFFAARLTITPTYLYCSFVEERAFLVVWEINPTFSSQKCNIFVSARPSTPSSSSRCVLSCLFRTTGVLECGDLHSGMHRTANGVYQQE